MKPNHAGKIPVHAELWKHGAAADDSVNCMRMLRRLRRATVAAAVWLVTVCLVASCANADPLGSATGSVKSIVVGSGDFPESQVIAEIYAQVLQANGFDVGRRLGIGSRETYIPALKDHSIDLVPEYIGNLLLYFQPDATVTMLDAVELELYKRLPGDLSILTPSPASDTDTVTVTAATAARCNLIGIGKTNDGYQVKLQRQLGIGADGQCLHFFSGSRHAARAVHAHQPRKRAFKMLAVLPSVFHQLNAQRVSNP